MHRTHGGVDFAPVARPSRESLPPAGSAGGFRLDPLRSIAYHSLPEGFLGSLRAVARVERGAREGEGYLGRGSICQVEDRLPWVPHQAGRVLADDMDVPGSNRDHY